MHARELTAKATFVKVPGGRGRGSINSTATETISKHDISFALLLIYTYVRCWRYCFKHCYNCRTVIAQLPSILKTSDV